jgi:hypothetical protein
MADHTGQPDGDDAPTEELAIGEPRTQELPALPGEAPAAVPTVENATTTAAADAAGERDNHRGGTIVGALALVAVAALAAVTLWSTLGGEGQAPQPQQFPTQAVTSEPSAPAPSEFPTEGPEGPSTTPSSSPVPTDSPTSSGSPTPTTSVSPTESATPTTSQSPTDGSAGTSGPTSNAAPDSAGSPTAGTP